jgi:hypothetical protein
VYGPDGQLRKEKLVDAETPHVRSVRVDSAGNIYLAVGLRPGKSTLPPGFQGRLPEGVADPNAVNGYNGYPVLYGSIVKFGPEGGKLYGFSMAPKPGDPPPPTAAANAPIDALVYTSGYLARDIKLSGLKWSYAGCSPVPTSDVNWGDPGCCCYGSQLDADEYGRVFAPNVCRFSVEMLDSAGHPITRIGRYGNVEALAGNGSGGQAPKPAFVWPAFVSVAGGKIYVADTVLRRVAVIALEYATSAESAMP